MSTLAFHLPGGPEWIVIAILALLIFGKRLPEVGRSVGRSIVEFKKGIKGIEDEIETETSKPDRERPLEPYDKRLGGDEAELRKLQEKGMAQGAQSTKESVEARPKTT